MNEEKNSKNYFVLDEIGNPIIRKGDEANPCIFNSLRFAYQFAEKEIEHHDAISIVEIKVIDRFGSGM